jgi:signal transduction histidine kinase
MAELLTPAAAAAADQAALLAQVATSRRDTVHYEADARRSDGRILRLAVAASAVRGADGSPVNISINLVDVTQRHAAEQERAARREAEVARSVAEAASRAKSDLLTAVSHELRTPLQAITGFTELLGTLDLSTERRRAALGHIEAATAHILSLVNDVLDIARIESGALPLQMQDVALGEVTSDVLNMLRPLADARGVALSHDQVTGTVRADDRRLRQVLINLVTNAIRYNRPAGSVRVTTEQDGGETILHVTDSGPGIPTELIGRLFVPFDRLGAESGPVPGAGLGLALTRGLTEAMGGRLLIDSTIDIGTTVSVVLRNRCG